MRNQGKTSGPIRVSYRVVEAVKTGRYHLRCIRVTVGDRPDFRDKTRREPCLIWDFEIVEHPEVAGKLVSTKTNTVYGNRQATCTLILDAFNCGPLTKAQIDNLDIREYQDRVLDAYLDMDDEGDGAFNRFDTFYPYKPDPKKS